MTDIQLENTLIESGALLSGHFLLTSGRHSDKYIEKFRVLEDPAALDKVCQAMAEQVSNEDVDIVLGAAIGGILLAGGVGRHLERRHIFTERVNGKMTLRRGFFISKGMRVLVVEDIITTGGSVLELIDVVKACKGEIVRVINLVDRNKTPIDFGVPATSLLRLPVESWEAEDCPLCRKNVPFTSRGRSGKN